jgi:hydroxymethylglutaryl-CoA lyase
MAGTAEVLMKMERYPHVKYPVLVPNIKGLQNLVALLAENSSAKPPLTDEIAVFVAASESFSKANINCTIAESLDRLVPVVEEAKKKGLRVRGYVSTVITCPFEGKIQPEKVRDVSRKMIELGCYEVSLGDTVGTGTPKTVTEMLNAVVSTVGVDKLAAHYHDTFGMAVSNVLTSVEAGIRTVDSSVGGLGGCPYSPGATGNVATEDVVHALHGIGYTTGIDLPILVETGDWISKQLGRSNASRAGTAWIAKMRREQSRKQPA